MSEPLSQQVMAPPDAPGRVLFRVCRGFALAGGGLLLSITVMSVFSVGSRWLTGRPILGDFELVQMGCAVAVAAFLPYCQMRRGHVLVDIFTNCLPARTRAILDGLGALLLAGCAALVAWRMTLGSVSLKDSGESSMLLGLPIWYAYLLMTPSFMLLAAAGLYTAIREFAGALR